MMNQGDIFNKIGQILSELNEQYQYLAQNPQELNELELELFLANSKFLSDHVQIIRKLNSKVVQKVLPEHAGMQAVETELHPVVKLTEVFDEPAAAPEVPVLRPSLEKDIFKLDEEPASFEFILSDKPSSDRFEFEEKSVGEIFDRPLSEEEEQIIAQKQKLREMDSLGIQLPEEDEIGPEPFLVSEPLPDEDPEEEDPVEDVPLEPIVEEPFKEEQPGTVEVPETIEEPETLKVPEPKEELVLEAQLPIAAVQLQEELFKPVPAAQPIAQNPVETAPVSPAFVKPTLNDILSGNTAAKSFNNGGSSRTPVTDLKQAISLNDKMRYIKDLFNGYNLAYAEAIDLVNKMPDFKTADAFLQNNYAVKNNWSARQETVDQFYELLNQRFPAVK